ncbi:cysteine rich repeat-containing protein [Hypericibacter sp.]|uniref:cysteine rich repeat-containing protein n=1 Tax=Hypericibacter sp. TaxID=2705401 RepID=UPI003D6D6ABC
MTSRMSPRHLAVSAAALMTFGLGLSGPAFAETPSTTPSRAQIQAVAKACRGDIQQFCETVQPGGGRILACMREHKDQLSQICHDAIAQASQAAPAGQ